MRCGLHKFLSLRPIFDDMKINISTMGYGYVVTIATVIVIIICFPLDDGKNPLKYNNAFNQLGLHTPLTLRPIR